MQPGIYDEFAKRLTVAVAKLRVEEQSSGIEQVNQAIGQMDQVTQQNGGRVT